MANSADEASGNCNEEFLLSRVEWTYLRFDYETLTVDVGDHAYGCGHDNFGVFRS